LALEAELSRDTKDKKGALAKAITSMEDNVSLISREILALNLEHNGYKLILVSKDGTSKFHNGCGGGVDRSGDTGFCRKCGKELNWHENAAWNITNRSIEIIKENQNASLKAVHPPLIDAGRRNSPATSSSESFPI